MTPYQKGAADMREAIIQGFERNIETIFDSMPAPNSKVPREVMRLQSIISAIRALKVNPHSPDAPSSSGSPDDSVSREL